MKENNFKKQLALVFDEDLRTRPYKWNNWVDILIIVMILLSTVAVFLGTFELSPAWQKVLKVTDWIVQIFFTVEVSLRIWAADEIDPKYKGFWGRVRYCFSFNGLIDFLATYPVWLGFAFPMMPVKLFQIFRVLRVARLFRVFRYMKAFRFLGEAVSSKKREMFVSLMFLIIVTIVLSFILFLVEHNANPDMVGNGWRSIVWSFAKYIGDPGQIVNEPLVTTGGKIISFLVGIMGIAIFAVPIGLLSSGFSEAIEKDTRSNELNDFRQRMKKAFRRTFNKPLRACIDNDYTGFESLMVVPQRVLVSKLQVQHGLTLDDIIETCNAFEEFRMKNLTSAQSEEESITDRFIVEHFPLNRKYGCYIPRQSKVTVVCPTSSGEVGVGWFTYYLAKLGGFNYISKEIEADNGEPDSFFNLSKEPLAEAQRENREAFMHDLEEASQAEWVIIVVHHIKNSDNPMDFHLATEQKDGSGSTVVDHEAYQQFVEQFAATMNAEFGLETATRSSRYPLLKKNLAYKIRDAHRQTNVVVLRPSSELIDFNARKLAIAYRMARLISEHFDGGRGMTDTDMADFKKTGNGYMENEG